MAALTTFWKLAQVTADAAEAHDPWVTTSHLAGVSNAAERLKVTEEQGGLSFFPSREQTFQVFGEKRPGEALLSSKWVFVQTIILFGYLGM